MIDLASLGSLIQSDPAHVQRMLQAMGLNSVEEVAQFGQPITMQNAAMGMPQPPPQAAPQAAPQPPPLPPQPQQPQSTLQAVSYTHLTLPTKA